MTTPDAPNISFSASIHLRNLAACTPTFRRHGGPADTITISFGEATLFVWDGEAGLVALRDALTAHLDGRK